MNFTWEALTAAQNALSELRLQLSAISRQQSERTTLSEEKLEKVDAYRKKFDKALSHDLNMPQALAVAWEVVKSNIPSPDKYDLILDFDEVLGLQLQQTAKSKQQAASVPKEIQKLLEDRETLRREKKFAEADEVRKTIEVQGYVVEDAPQGVSVKKKTI